jgi:hypothetical protein
MTRHGLITHVRLYAELAVWNFNGPGYAMFREDILDRAK